MLNFCRFETIKDTVPNPSSVADFRALVEGFAPAAPFGIHVPAPYKEAVPLFSVVSFKEGTRSRKASQLEYVNAAVFDLDDVPADAIERIHLNLVNARINHCLRSSYSDKGMDAEKRRFRAVLELDHPIPTADWGDLWDRLDAKYMERLSDGQCKDPNRIYYMPSFPGHTDVRPQSFVYLDGEPVPSGRILAEPRQAPPAPELPDQAKASLPMLQDLVKRLRRRKDPADGYALHMVLSGHPFAEKGSRDLTLFRVCCRIAEAFPDIDPTTVVPFFRASLREMHAKDPTDPLTEEQVLEKLGRAKVSASQTMAAQQAAAEDSTRGAIRRAFEAVGIKDRFHPYTVEEIVWMADLLGCREEDFHRYLCVVVEGSCWVWVFDRYVGPYPIRTVAHIARMLLMPATTAGFTPDVETPQGAKPISSEHLLSRFATIASGLSYSAINERSSYDASSQRLILAACARRRDLKPQWHTDVDAWFRALAGTKYDELLEWLAAFGQWDRPLKVGLFIGRGGTGKSLLVSGLSNIFQASAACNLGEVMGNNGFNADLKYTLVCAAEESAPKDIRGESRTAELRDFISLRNHTIRVKYQPNATLVGSARVVMTANNDGMFAGTNDLTLDDIEAIQERFFLLQCSEGAKTHLDGVPTETKAHWAQTAIAEHVLYLHQNMEDYVDLSRRFLGPAASHDFTDRMLIQSGSRSTLLHWLSNFLEMPKQAAQYQRFFTYDEPAGVLYANTNAILSSWSAFAPGNAPCPTARRLGTDLQALANTGRKAFCHNGRSYWAYPVDVSKLIQWAERYGVGVEEEIVRSLKALSVGTEVLP